MSLFTRFYYPTKLIFQRFAAPAVIYSPWTKSLLNVCPSIKIKVPRLFLIEKKNSILFFCAELFTSSDRPNWYQRVRIAVGIVEFFSDIWHFEDTDEHFYLCQPLIKSFGFDKDYESKVTKKKLHFLDKITLKSPLDVKIQSFNLLEIFEISSSVSLPFESRLFLRFVLLRVL